jgi:hypothetical protein
MIRPTKYLNLKTCLLNVASIILLELKQFHALRLAELEDKVRVSVADNARFNYIPALNFLFVAGIIDYDLETDSVYLLI